MNNAMHPANRGGIIRELLRTPVFKDIIRNNTHALQYGSGSTMVKTVMGQDPEVFLNLAVSTPALVNIFTRALAELGQQLKSQYPPDTLAVFMESILGEIDTGSLKQCGLVWKDLISSLLRSSPEVMKKLAGKALSAGPATAAQTIDILSRALNSLERGSPGALSGFITDMLLHVDRPGASNAARLIAGAVLDQKWHVCSRLFGLMLSRIRKRFTLRRSC